MMYIPIGHPELFNTDQGGQFTGAAFAGVSIDAGARIAMDGRGRWMDNVVIERLRRSLEREDVYLKGYADGIEARAATGEWIALYNERRLRQAPDDRAPMAVFRDRPLAGACGHVDNTLPCRANPSRCALTTCPQRERKQQPRSRAA
jgi:putative transposase